MTPILIKKHKPGNTMRIFLLIVSVIALAGCSTNSPAEQPSASTTTSVPLSPSIPQMPVGPILTDTLFLMEAPHLNGQRPTGADPYQGRVPFDADPLAIPLEWSMPYPSLSTITANGTLFFEVRGSAYSTTPECFWGVSMVAEAADGSGIGSAFCASEQFAVTPGIKQVDFAITLEVGNMLAEHLRLSVTTSGISPPGTTLILMAGSADYPSHLTIAGLQVPIDTQTVLF